ncbi:disulfide bond formation protein B [Marinobacterium arenosum]|uniref:disulfide bond formation protein B n=1 Tax=Marinobacterium arenosum TaxID=2862496 RepID=UPI001C97D32F|nr:disulfide bond formation protein B [Marinobacterium arenosum]MBY4676005.1 disulfide bond formation protein B [Marinobacterium arenosum]
MLNSLSRSSGYWLLLILLVLAMEGIALFYQYVLDYGPCVLCVQIRIWLLALGLVGVLALLLKGSRGGRLFSHLASTVVAVGLLERSWNTLAVERGWLEGACDMDVGLPDWFALDRWLPALFEPWEPCGYTPELLFGITMAEGLILFSATLLLVSAALTLTTLRQR